MSLTRLVGREPREVRRVCLAAFEGRRVHQRGAAAGGGPRGACAAPPRGRLGDRVVVLLPNCPEVLQATAAS